VRQPVAGEQTSAATVHAVATQFARHFNRSPTGSGWRKSAPTDPPHHDRHLVGRLQRRGLRPAFFYGVTLGRTAMVERASCPRAQASAIAGDLERRWVVRFLRGRLPSLKHRTAFDDRLWLPGFASEVVRLKTPPHRQPLSGSNRARAAGTVHHAVAAAPRRCAA